MENNKIKELFTRYGLTSSDYFKHKHYQIITRQGIDKIQAKERIFIEYDVVNCDPEFCAVKASASKDSAKIQTFGSAKYGGKVNKDGKWIEIGNTTTWYLLEMAEKRAMSRAVLKLTGFYELGVFGEDESEDFKKGNTTPTPTTQKVEPLSPSLINRINDCVKVSEITTLWNANKDIHKNKEFIDLIAKRGKILKDNGIT